MALVIVVAFYATVFMLPLVILGTVALVDQICGRPIDIRGRITSFVYGGGTPARNWDYYEIRVGTAGRERRVLGVRDEATARSGT